MSKYLNTLCVFGSEDGRQAFADDQEAVGEMFALTVEGDWRERGVLFLYKKTLPDHLLYRYETKEVEDDYIYDIASRYPALRFEWSAANPDEAIQIHGYFVNGRDITDNIKAYFLTV